MPVYEYIHEEEGECARGARFEVVQNIKDAALRECPECGKPVRRLISRTYVRTPLSDTKYKEMGFTKLVRRDNGVYENVTALDGESRYFEADKPETMPDIKRRVSD
ncbi:zinc ribbon domain-containing protein [Candidatus Sumerlaeota bacterium]|nr:zinc ribbon domain-containing protein [Candidatus Sumerlaeota bacterium]